MENAALKQREGAIYGIDISDERALISYINPKDKRPATVSRIFGEENYVFPMAIAKKSGIGQWFIGDEAIERKDDSDVTYVPDFYQKALKNENIIIDAELFSGEEVFAIYIRRLFAMAQNLSGIRETDYICFSVTEVNKDIVGLLDRCAARFGIPAEKVGVIEKKEAFYYYCLSQPEEMRKHDVLLFENNEQAVYAIRLNVNYTLTPRVVSLEEKYFTLDERDKDSSFDGALQEMLKGSLVSTIYLTGSGFSRDWMHTSLQRAMLGHKVFAGQNLYTNGACYAALVRLGTVEWPFLYIGDNELKLNVSLLVSDLNQMKFYTLINAGKSWYEERGECEVILDGDPSVSLYIQKPDSRKAVESVLSLSDLPERESRLTRLRITAVPLSDTKVSVQIFDLGFGEIEKGSGKTFTTTIGID